MKLITKRLVLRNLKNSDEEDLIKEINNLKVSKWLLLVPYPYTKKDARWWVNHCKKEFEKNPIEDYNFGVELKTEKKIIGGIGICHVEQKIKSAEIGYWLGEKHWGKGYGSEMLKEILKFGFNKLKLRRIYAEVFKGNIGSEKLLKKFGFKKEGLLRKAAITKSDKKIKDVICFGLLKSERKLK